MHDVPKPRLQPPAPLIFVPLLVPARHGIVATHRPREHSTRLGIELRVSFEEWWEGLGKRVAEKRAASGAREKEGADFCGGSGSVG